MATMQSKAIKTVFIATYCIAVCALSFAQSSLNGYSVPATGFGLSFELGPGTCTAQSGTVVKYAGSRISLTANATNFGYLDTTCALAQNTGSFPAGDIPIWIAVTNATDVTSLTDSRTSYNFTGAGSSGLPTAGNGDHVTTTFLAGGGSNGDCLQWLAGGAIGDTGAPCGVSPGAVVKNPTAGTSQNIVQGINTSFGSNIIANTRVVTPDWNWSQSPAGTLTAATPATVTLTPCPKGMDLSGNTTHPYRFLLSAVGTTEVALATGGTCSPDAASGTVTFTPAFNHGAGYAIGSSTAGYQEAWNDAKTENGSPAHPFAVWSAASQNINLPQIYSTIYLWGNFGTFMGNGVVLGCLTRDKCMKVTSGVYTVIEKTYFAPLNIVDGVQVADVTAAAGTFTVHTASAHTYSMTGNFGQPDQITIHYWTLNDQRSYTGPVTSVADNTHFTFVLGSTTASNSAGFGFVNIENAALEVDGDGAVCRDCAVYPQVASINDRFSDGIILDNDQNFTLDRFNNFASGDSIECQTINWCGHDVYVRGDSGNAGILYVLNSEMSMQCHGNGILNLSGNSMSIVNSVIQGQSQYAMHIENGLQGDWTANQYQEASQSCVNFLYTGNLVFAAGIFVQGQEFTLTGTTPITGTASPFASGGGSGARINYFVVPHASGRGVGPILPIGTAEPANGAVVINVQWPALSWFDGSGFVGTITYDLIATTGAGSVTPLFGTGTWLVSALVACTPTNAGMCSFSDTQAARTSYSVASQNWFYPAFAYFWPGDFVLGNTTLYTTRKAVSQVIASSRGTVIPSVVAQACEIAGAGNFPSADYAPVWIQCLGGLAPIMPQQYDSGNNSLQGVKGILNLGSQGNLLSGQGTHYITLEDSVPNKQKAFSGQRAPADFSDVYIGTDCVSGSHCLTLGANVSISNYISNVGFDGTSWKERLTSSLKSFTVNVTTNQQYQSTLATGTAPLVIASTTQVANLNVGTIDGVTLTGTPSVGQVPTATSASAATWQTPSTTPSYDTTWSHTSNSANVGTSITLAQADLVANAEWVMQANIAVADAGGTSPALATQVTLGGTNVTSCAESSTGASNNGATVRHHYAIRIKVLTTGVSGTAKVQCNTDQVGGAATGTVNGASNLTDATTTINTTGAVALTWTCSDSNGTATCHYYDSYTLKLH